MENRIFFPQALLDAWISAGRAEIDGDQLRLVAEGRRFRLDEGVKIVREVSGAEDARHLAGRAKPRRELERLGAEIVESSMLIGEAAYEVEPGWLGTPVGDFASYLAASGPRWIRSPEDPADPGSDEELLLRLAQS